jgi:hypothetical protein
MYASLILIFVPSITNIYYTFRPNSSLAKVMPFAMPVICLTQYLGAMKYDLENFCFQESDSAETLRKKYIMLS